MPARDCPHCGAGLPPGPAADCPACGGAVRAATPAPLNVKFLARLLALRDRPVTLGLLLQLSLPAMLLTALVVGAGAAWFVFQGQDLAAAATGGVLAGAILRDFGTLRRSARLWPTQAAVLDWDEIERLVRAGRDDAPAL